MATATAPTSATALEPAPAGTQELMTAIRSLFTCTRKVRGWVADAGATTMLGVVADHGEAKVSAIAAALHMDVSTASRTLSALCRDGLVQWRTDEHDGRSHLVSCTAAGEERLASRRTQMLAELDRRLADWPAADVDELSTLLNRFVDSLLLEPAEITEPVDPTEPVDITEPADSIPSPLPTTVKETA